MTESEREAVAELHKIHMDGIGLVLPGTARTILALIDSQAKRIGELEMENGEAIRAANINHAAAMNADDRCDTFRAQLKVAREALEFYGDEKNYRRSKPGVLHAEYESPVLTWIADRGRKARAALKELTPGPAPASKVGES